MNKMKLKTFIRAYERGQKCLDKSEHGCIQNPYSDDGPYHNAWNLGWADARYVERLAANMKTIRIKSDKCKHNYEQDISANSAIKAAETEFKRINRVKGCHLRYP